MPLKIAFIGYDAEQTREFFKSFARVNADQIATFRENRGLITLHDGTEIRAILRPADDLQGRRFDQVIFAYDRRLPRPRHGFEWFMDLERRMAVSVVPPDFRWQIFDSEQQEV